MKTSRKLTLLIFAGLFLSACNTLHNVKTVDIEIFVPANAIFPEKFDTIAIRYNNFNEAYNPNFAAYFEKNRQMTDSTNTDSLAAETYYRYFLHTLKSNSFFDSVIEIERTDYSKTILSDSILEIGFIELEDSLNSILIPVEYEPVANFWSMAGKFQPQKENSGVRYLDPLLGLYSREELVQLADSTNSKILLSLDYFAIVDRKYAFDKQKTADFFDVFVIAYWNFYDLKNLRLSYYYDRVDTVTWDFHEGVEIFPPREDAIQKAAEISAVQFAGFLIPHWIEVQRMVYRSGNVDLKKADALAAEGKWLEAAEIWRKHVESPNKKIAAKSKFNMALACEILGQLDAAVDWAVQSYLVFGQKNPVHEQNSLQYINILNQRKLDVKRIEYQFNPEFVPLQ
jgi:hypothetical protein